MPGNNLPFPGRLRYVNELVGFFLLAGIAVMLAAVALAPQTWRWFSPTVHLTVRLPQQGSLGLRRGADVLVLGTVVGSVNEIVVDDAGDMDADVSIRGNFGRFVRSDSRAFIRKPLGIGDTMIEITRGKGAPLSTIGATTVIDATADKAPTEMVEELLRDVREETAPAAHELRKAVAEYTQLAAELRQRQAQVGETLVHVNAIATRVESGPGVAAAILNDARLADSVRSASENLQVSVARANTMLRDGDEMILAMRRTVAELPGLLIQTEQSLRQIQRLSEKAQGSWLLSGGASAPLREAPLGVDRPGRGK